MNKSNIILLNIVVLSIILMLVGSASATDYYVATAANGGNDGNAGTLGEPWLTILYSATQVTAGDTIYVSTGQYYDKLVAFTNNGIAGSPISLRTYNGTVDIDSSGVPAYSFIADSDKSYITIDGDFVIENAFMSIQLFNSSNIIVKNITGQNLRGTGLQFVDGCKDILIDNITIDNSSHNGIMIYGSDWDQHGYRANHNVTISNCLVINNAVHNGIDIHSNNHNITVNNNTVRDNPFVIGIFVHSAQTQNTNVTVTNNTVYRNGNGIYFHGTNDSIISHNLVYDNTNPGIKIWVGKEDGFDNITFNLVDNITIHNNTIYNNSQNIDMSNENVSFESPTNITVKHNTVYDSQHAYGMDVMMSYMTGKDLLFYDNNLFTENRTFYIYYVYRYEGYTVKSDYIFTNSGTFPDAKYYSNGTGIATGIDDTPVFTTYLTHLLPDNDNLESVSKNTYSNGSHNYSIDSSVAENPTWINDTVANASDTYDVLIDGVLQSTETPINGIISYQYSIAGNEWDTAHDIEIKWNSSGPDVTSPTSSNQGTNTTIFGTPCEFSIDVNDNVALSSNGTYKFSTNNSGIWVNSSEINFTSTPETIYNNTLTLNSTNGLTVGYRWYIRDNAGNWGNTSIFTITTTGWSPTANTTYLEIPENWYTNGTRTWPSVQPTYGNIEVPEWEIDPS